MFVPIYSQPPRPCGHLIVWCQWDSEMSPAQGMGTGGTAATSQGTVQPRLQVRRRPPRAPGEFIHVFTT